MSLKKSCSWRFLVPVEMMMLDLLGHGVLAGAVLEGEG